MPLHNLCVCEVGRLLLDYEGGGSYLTLWISTYLIIHDKQNGTGVFLLHARTKLELRISPAKDSYRRFSKCPFLTLGCDPILVFQNPTAFRNYNPRIPPASLSKVRGLELHGGLGRLEGLLLVDVNGISMFFRGYLLTP